MTILSTYIYVLPCYLVTLRCYTKRFQCPSEIFSTRPCLRQRQRSILMDDEETDWFFLALSLIRSAVVNSSGSRSRSEVAAPRSRSFRRFLPFRPLRVLLVPVFRRLSFPRYLLCDVVHRHKPIALAFVRDIAHFRLYFLLNIWALQYLFIRLD